MRVERTCTEQTITGTSQYNGKAKVKMRVPAPKEKQCAGSGSVAQLLKRRGLDRARRTAPGATWTALACGKQLSAPDSRVD